MSKEIYDSTTSIRIRLWINRTRGSAGKIDKRSCTLTIPSRTNYMVTYNKNSTYNGYTDNSVDLPNSQSKYYNSNITLSSAPT